MTETEIEKLVKLYARYYYHADRAYSEEETERAYEQMDKIMTQIKELCHAP